jgi:hypothetical protein
VINRLIRYLIAVVVATAGLAVVTGTAAHAVGGCRTTAAVGACVDHATDSGQVRADFYLNSGPSSSVYQYRVSIVVNGNERFAFDGKRRFTSTGRYCCWYRAVRNLPPKAQEAHTRVYVYRSDGVFHYRADSPVIRYTE